jgi:hypothetical protein
MKLLDYTINLAGRADEVTIYPLGDVHTGAKNCAEKQLMKVVREIEKNPLARWLGGGDLINAIKPDDLKRFDVKALPNWLFVGDAETIKERLSDIVVQETERITEILEPIKDKCIGLIEGNHERTMRKRYNYNAQKDLCEKLGVVNLYSAAWIRMFFRNRRRTSVMKIGIRHGYGGGRAAGAEPKKLADLLSYWPDCSLVFSGHTHTAEHPDPTVSLYLPNTGALPKELLKRYRWAANWGCWLLTHASGASTYEEDACYPPRPMVVTKAVITPFYHTTRNSEDYSYPKIEMQRITL